MPHLWRVVRSVAPIVATFIFAILYFCIMTGAGMLDPIIDRILHMAGCQSHAHCSRDRGPGAIGASRRFGAAFLVTVPVMLPLYERLGMDKRILACAASMGAGVSFLPWTGPMIRASAALHIPSTTIFAPLVLVQLTGLAFVFFELERKISGQHTSDPQLAREDR